MLQSATRSAAPTAAPVDLTDASRYASVLGHRSQLDLPPTPPPIPDPLPDAVGWATREFGGAKLGDPRQVISLQAIAAAKAAAPHRSFTAACGPGRRQAAHRIFEHPETTIDGILAGHYAQTAVRCRDLPVVLVAQDTCFFVYQQSQIVGLAQVNQSQKSRALLGHAALALSPAGTPLGLVALDCWGEAPEDAPRLAPGKRLPPEERESAKWGEALKAVAIRLPDAPRVLVLADREADITSYLTQPRRPGLHHLVRVVQNRVVTAPGESGEPEPQLLLAALAKAPVLGTYTLDVPRRKSETQQIMLPARKATLEVRVQPVHLRPRGAGGVPTQAWVIQASELDSPEGEPPLHWVLVTTEETGNFAAAVQMVTYYARRWVIERLHFTLKSGLRAERLQIDDAISLKHALAVYYVIAWRLLYLTYLARAEPDAPATDAFEADELTVLAGGTGRSVETVGQAVLAVAELGGWQRYRTAPPPGVKSLWVGWITLRGMVRGYRLALSSRQLEL
jgi:Transposase DNA-binding/Transposase DDE domain